MSDKEKIIRILCDALDGCPLVYPCDKLFSPDVWCREHCKSQEPDAECWLKYAKVMAEEAKNSNENALDAISRQAAIDAFDKQNWSLLNIPICKEIRNAAKDTIRALPSADPERKKGKWIVFDSDDDKYDEIKCDCCKKGFTVDAYHWTDIGFTKEDLKFCPNCGADMREGDTT